MRSSIATAAGLAACAGLAAAFTPSVPLPSRASLLRAQPPPVDAAASTTVGKHADALQCQHFEVCSGCSTNGGFEAIPTAELARTRLAAFLRADATPGAAVPPAFALTVGRPHGWRVGARLAVAPGARTNAPTGRRGRGNRKAANGVRLVSASASAAARKMTAAGGRVGLYVKRALLPLLLLLQIPAVGPRPTHHPPPLLPLPLLLLTPQTHLAPPLKDTSRARTTWWPSPTAARTTRPSTLRRSPSRRPRPRRASRRTTSSAARACCGTPP